MEIRTVQCAEKKLIGLRVVGRRQELSHRVPLAWLELVEAVGRIENLVDDGLFYGVFLESDLAGDDHYRYWVGTEVHAFGTPPEGMEALVLPGGAYATTTIAGGPEKIDEAYIALGRLIAAKGGDAAKAGRYGFERYDVRRQPPTPPYERFDYDLFRPLGAAGR